MKAHKTIRTILSFILAFALVLPGAVKVDAAATYPIGGDSLILDAEITGVSTNNHTVSRVIWTYGGYVYLMIDSTHDVIEIKLHNASGQVVSTDLDRYAPWEPVTVGGTTYLPNESQGNTNDSHLTVFKFPLSSMLSQIGLNDTGEYMIDVISDQGKGHWIYGTLSITVPRAKAIVTKTWDGGPKDPVKMQLYREYVSNGGSPTSYGSQFTLTPENPTKTFSDIGYTDNLGRIYKYSVKEVNLGEGYTADYAPVVKELVNGVYVFTIGVKNTYTPPMTNIKITKIWKDEAAADRPASITYRLYADGGTEPVRVESTDAGKEWKLTFSNLPKTTNAGVTIVYTVKEDPVPGYATSIDGFTVTNVRTGKTDIDVDKVWKDTGDDSLRPASVKFNLLANGSKVDDILVTQANGWKATFKDVDKYDENGKLIKYTITEEAVTGYTSTVDKFTITNVRSEKMSIPVEKFWKDEGPEGRPAKVVINLLGNGSLVKSMDLTSGNDWKGSFTNIDKFDSDGKLIVYTITEDAVEGYKSDTKDFKVTNTRVGTRDIKVEKTWLDDGDTAGRPDKIMIYLFAGETQVDSKELTAEMNWTHTFKDKAMFTPEGKLIVYTIKEKAVDGYQSSIKDFKVTNLRVGKTEVSVEKIWKDNNDIDARPASITVNLLANGTEVKDMAVTAAMDWKYTFKDLAKYDEFGKVINYTVTEDEVAGYNSSVDGLKITNTRVGKVDIPVEKFWKDEGPEGRPSSITVNLLANGVEVAEKEITSGMEWKYTFADFDKFDENGKVITYTITEDDVLNYKGKVEGFKITNTRTGDRDIIVEKFWKDDNVTSARPLKIRVDLLANGEVVDTEYLTSEMGWTYRFEDKPVFDSNGKTIIYTIKEGEVKGYVSSIDGFEITNTRTGKIDIPVEKIWLDNGERDALEVKVELYKEVVSLPPVDVQEIIPQAVALELVGTLTLDEENNWKDTFKNLPEFDENGRLISYFLKEVEVEGYQSSIKENEDGSYTVTNLRVGMVKVEGEKIWFDEEGTSLRPETITVILLRNGEEVDRMDIGEEEDWKFSFTELQEFDNKGIAFKYIIDEVDVEGYRSKIDGFDIMNTREGVIDIPVEKIWMDNGERETEEVTVHLYRMKKGMEILEADMDHEHVAEAKLTEDNDFKFTFTDLPEFDDEGMPIVYILKEVEVEGYESTVLYNEDGSITVTNLRVGVRDIMGEKTWFDEGEESRPDSITVILNRNGEELDEIVVTADEEGNWNFEFLDLPEFDEEGIAYLYEVEEMPVEGYNTYIVGFDIQNVRVGQVNVNGEKTWDDIFGRPESITVNLLQNGVEIDEMVVTPEDDKWTYSFTELPEFDEEGIAYVYTVTEDPVAGYEAVVEGYDILNRQLRGTLRIIKVDDFDFPVEDAVFEVEDEEGTLVFTGKTDEDGILEAVLPLGTYIVTEVSAPEGFIMDTEPKTVVIGEDMELVELTVVNILEIEEISPKPLPEPKPELPKTGAQSEAVWYGMGLFLALGGLLLLRKRKTV